MPEWFPKCTNNVAKSTPGDTQGCLIHHFYGFWVVSKNRSFLMSSWGFKKSTKIEPWGAKGSQRWLRVFGRGATAAAGGPCQRLARVLRIKEFFEEGTTTCLNTPQGTRPGEFLYICIFICLYYYYIIILSIIEFGHWRNRPIYEQNSAFLPPQKIVMIGGRL